MDVLVSNYNNQGGKVVKNLTPFFYSFEAHVDGHSTFNGRVAGFETRRGNKYKGLIIQPFFYTFIENNSYARKK